MAEEIRSDAAARKAIINQTDKNFFVKAGAGSGKTYSLVERLLSMVKNGIDEDEDSIIGKICAITFTKAAANEFYDRFYKRLTQALKEDELTDVERRRVAHARDNIDNCFLGTIDSFCNLIISEYPSFAGVPSDSTVLSKAETNAEYCKHLAEIKNGSYGEEFQKKYRAFANLFYDPEQAFCAIAAEVMERKNCGFVYKKPDTLSFEEKFAKEKKEFEAVFDDIAKNKDLVYCKTSKDEETQKKYRRDWKMLIYSLRNIHKDWDSYILQVISLFKNFKDLKIDKGVVSDKYPDYFEKRGQKESTGYRLKIGIVDQIEAMKFSIALDFVVPACKEISQQMKEEGKLSYFDYLLYLRDMLKNDIKRNDCKLITHIRSRHRYFLIDEFQDTNPLQAEVFFYLSSENPVSDWRKCVPAPGSLFIVGDPKQSIYRFRGADVNSYQDVESLFAGEVGEEQELTMNFRSTVTMCNAFNKNFVKTLEENENNGTFSPIPPKEAKPEGTLKGTYFYTISKGDDITDFAFVSKIISEIVDNEEYTVLGIKEDKPRKIRYSDIMVITYTKTNLPKYLARFKADRIPVKIEGTTVYGMSAALTALSKVYAYLANPGVRYYKYSAEKTGLLDGLSEDRLKEIKNLTYTMSPVALLGTLQQKLHIIENCGSDNLEYYEHALELVRSAESNGEITSHKEASQLLEKIIKGGDDYERCASLQREENCVHVANLHKVKGLEAPVVILAGNYARKKEIQFRIEEENGEKKCWIFKVRKPDNFNDYYISGNDGDDVPQSKREEDSIKSEVARLNYVAATRAGSALIIADGDGNDPWLPLIRNFPDCRPFRFTESDDVEKPEEESRSITESKTVFAGSKADTQTLEIVLPSKTHGDLKAQSRLTADEEVPQEEAGSNPTGVAATKRGTAIHRLMEVLVSSRNACDVEALSDEIMSDYGIDSSAFRDVILTVADTVRNGGFPQNNCVPQDILAEALSADEAHCELPFCYKAENIHGITEIHNGVIDLAYLKDGSWHIVDYKTDTVDKDNLDAKHGAQMREYEKAFFILTGQKCEAHTYSIPT